MNRTAMALPFGQSRTRSARVVVAALAAGLLAPAALAAHTSASASTAPALSRVVVTSVAGSVDGVARAAAAVRAAGGRVLADLPLVGGVSATLPTGTLLAPPYRVVPDRTLTVSGTKDDSNSTDSLLSVRAALGLGKAHGEGAGVTVAVVDTGVADVTDLRGRVTHVDTGAGTGDQYGHGTFVAGLIAGSGRSSDGKYAGIAPEARILDVKVADASGSTSLTAVLTGLQAVAAARPAVDVVNLSLSSGSLLPYQIDPLTVALEQLWRRGITVVVPTGNDPTHIASPGNDPLLLTVGGLDPNGTPARSDDAVAEWSGRGPTAQGDAKPDLIAPGAHVVSLAVPGSVIDGLHKDARVAGGYFKGSGSSFSTAITSGAAAAVLSKRPRLSPDQIKAVLTDSAYPMDGSGAGAGGLDLPAAYGTAPADAQDIPAVQIPGDPAVWQAYIDAVLAGHADVAAKNWADLSEAAKNWAASSWSNLSAAMQEWAAKNWAASSWSENFSSDGDWAAQNWAAMNWAAQNWAAQNWAASSWSASSWSAANWAAKNWAATDWDSKNWAAANWAAQNWAAQNWAAANWAAANWAAANWAAANWAAANWAAANWS